MSDTKTPAPLPPLVSDEELDKWQDSRKGGKGGIGFKWTAPKVRDIYEADRAKTREVVQRLVDLIFHDSDCGQIMNQGRCDCFAAIALSLAKSQLNIEPTNP